MIRSLRVWHAALLVVAVATLLNPLVVHGQTSTEIAQLNVDAKLSRTGQLNVTEKLVYDFGDTNQLGFSRRLYIPATGMVTIQNVSRDNLKEDYRTIRAGQSLRIITGTKGIRISGKHTYTLEYTVDGVIQAGQSGLQLVWPVIAGTNIPVENITVDLQLPGSSTAVRCRIGVQNQGCPVDQTDSGVRATAAKLKPKERLTIRANIPRSSVEVTAHEKEDRYSIYWTGLALLVFFSILWTWYRLGPASQEEVPKPKTPEHIDTLDE